MTYLPFLQVDVFSERRGEGNPLAVVLGAETLPERTLARFAAWTSGRAAGADYRVRIFTPSSELLGLTPDHARLKDLGQDVGVVDLDEGAQTNGQPGAFVRAFSPSLGTSEDPVTGSLNASLAQWLIGEGLAPRRYLVAQGECRGRAGRVTIEQDDDGQVWVGGNCLTAIEGRAQFPTA